MKTKQQIVGDVSEKEIATDCFRKNGYWAYITAKKINGQPVDIIAMKNNINWLVDAKHLDESKKSFPFYRIEPNQIDTLNFAKKKGLKNLGFVICQGSVENNDYKTFFLPFDKLIELMQNNANSVKLCDLEDFMEVLKRAS